ncbi:Receptor-like protein 4 [Ancistrocladus abbreviatus]
MFNRFLFLLFSFLSIVTLSASRAPPYAMRISCGARVNVHTKPTDTLWYKDFAYTGGVPANATRPSFITPPLSTLRYFPLSEGPENCYHINRVPSGHYSVRMFFGLVADPNFDNEPLFDVSVEGTLVYSLNTGWSTGDSEQVFAEALVFLTEGTASLCFHSTGHGDPAVLSIEILQVDDKAYYFGPQFGHGIILRTAKRLSCGAGKPKFDEDYSGSPWGGDRFWNPITTFGQSSDKAISTESAFTKASVAPNFYPAALYQTAIVSTDTKPDLTYAIDVEPNSNYSVWLHFAEIDPSVTNVGQRVFDILINGDIIFKAVDIVSLSGGQNTALILNATVAVNGRTLTITIHPTKGSHAIINAIEVFQIIIAEAKTLPSEVSALQSLKRALQLPHRFGWNGDPCIPQQHPWTGADCHFDSAKGKWFIDGLGLDNQGLRGFLPNDISQLGHLQSINLSGNSIRGAIPSSLGNITGLVILDLSYNSFNGSIPESLGQLNSLRILNLNSNKVSGKVPAALGGMLLHRASFNFTDNAGLCGIPGLPACGRLSAGATAGIALASCIGFIFVVICSLCWWKRRQNILRAQQIAAREAPYAKARTHFSRDVQMTIHARTASENGPILLS